MRRSLISDEKKARLLRYTQQRACLFASQDDYIDLLGALYKQEFDFSETLFRQKMRLYIFDSVHWRRYKTEYPRMTYLNLMCAIYSKVDCEVDPTEDVTANDPPKVSPVSDDEEFRKRVLRHRYVRPRFSHRRALQPSCLNTLYESC